MSCDPYTQANEKGKKTLAISKVSVFNAGGEHVMRYYMIHLSLAFAIVLCALFCCVTIQLANYILKYIYTLC